VTPATEIQVFAMHDDRIAERGEEIHYYDILVRGDPDEGGIIPEIEEHDDLTETEMLALVPVLEAKYALMAEQVGG